MARNMISTTVYLTPEQIEMLKDLSYNTRVDVAKYIREAIDDLLEKYEDEIADFKEASWENYIIEYFLHYLIY